MPNFVSGHRGSELKEGMTIAIEPMITAGGPDVYVHDDDWSISTADGSLAAHFEHTVAITAQGPRILTIAHEGPGTMSDPARGCVLPCAASVCPVLSLYLSEPLSN